MHPDRARLRRRGRPAVADALGRDGGARGGGRGPQRAAATAGSRQLRARDRRRGRARRTHLDGCPDARLLATSREPLGVDGEQVLQLGPLGLPKGAELEALERSEAVALFADRARAARWDFELSTTTPSRWRASAAGSTASRSRSSSPRRAAARSPRRRSRATWTSASRCSRGRARARAQRHRTLRATIDWSYRLLSGRSGSPSSAWPCSPAASTSTPRRRCARDGVEPGQMLDLLDRLVQRSLLVASEENGITSYGMLESLRHYAARAARGAGRRAACARPARGPLRRAHRRHPTRRRGALDEGHAARRHPRLRRGSRGRALVDPKRRTHERSFRLVASLWPLCTSLHAAEIAALCRQALERWPSAQATGSPRTRWAPRRWRSSRPVSSTPRSRTPSRAIAAERDDEPPAALARRALALVTYGFLGDVEDGLERIDDAVHAAHAAGKPAIALEMSVLRTRPWRRPVATRTPSSRARRRGARRSAWRARTCSPGCCTCSERSKAGGDERARACFDETPAARERSEFFLIRGAACASSAPSPLLRAATTRRRGCSSRRTSTSPPPVTARSAGTSCAPAPRSWLGAAAATWPRAFWPARRPTAARAAPRRSRRRASRELSRARGGAAGRVARTAAPRGRGPGGRRGAARARCRPRSRRPSCGPAPTPSVRRASCGGSPTRERSAHLPDLKGLHDLVRLLAARRGDPLPRARRRRGRARARARPRRTTASSAQGHAGELLDERGRAEFKRRIEDLREDVELAEAAGDDERAERRARSSTP